MATHFTQLLPILYANIQRIIRNNRLVCDTKSVISVIRKAVSQKSVARTIDCGMIYCVIVRSIILFCIDKFTYH